MRGDNSQQSYLLNYDYDTFGNRLQKQTQNQNNPLLQSWVETGDISPLTNRFTSGVTYDAAGNVTSDSRFRLRSRWVEEDMTGGDYGQPDGETTPTPNDGGIPQTPEDMTPIDVPSFLGFFDCWNLVPSKGGKPNRPNNRRRAGGGAVLQELLPQL